ncbi:MAG TPA: molybdopterin cofactor-binding domain-containing protein [Xanthobacteraceae bacterium]|jgi:isoquinoline 1-oxidoreductase beta subunit|nr:molybdopterin cofactor-binding domain-containing protein [Xanthobacteraceae bacterium]
MTVHLRNADISRRGFMIGAAGLTFAVASRLPVGPAQAAGKEAVLSPWVTISTDDTVAIMSPAAEMGQGSLTSLPLILAEELDADWSKVRIVVAPPNDALYKNPAFGFMYTAGSNAVTAYFKDLRRFGAQVRKVLLANAARHWNVPVEELATEPNAVVHAKSGRRLTYGEIAAFAEVPARAPEVAESELKRADQFRFIGKDVMRVELPQKVNGTAQYGIDVQVPGMLYGAILRGPVEGAAPDRIDDAKAKSIAGVVQIVALPYGVGVIAETPWAAFNAKEALKVAWTRTGKAWGFNSEKALNDFAAAARDMSQPAKLWGKEGDAVAALQSAATVVESEYRNDLVYHAQMEPLNAVAAVSPAGDACELWCGVQSKTIAVTVAADALKIAPDKIAYHDMLMGGGFGRRGHRDEEYVHDAVVLSNAVKRPVKMMWTREDDVHNGRFNPLSVHYLRAGFDAAGKLIAFHHRKACDEVTAFQDPVRYERSRGRDVISFVGIDAPYYAIPNRLGEAVPRESGLRTSSLRGISHLTNIFAIESFMDELAQKRGADPAAFRRDLVSGAPRALAIIDRVAHMADWGRKRDGSALGFAYMNYSGTQIALVAEASVDRRTGVVRVPNVWCALDPGIAVQPDNIVAQTESSIVYGLGFALFERITINDGAVQESNFYDYHVPRLNEIPQMFIEVLATDNHPTGVGQMATPLVAPAIANAVAELTGARLRETPMSPDRVKKALG